VNHVDGRTTSRLGVHECTFFAHCAKTAEEAIVGVVGAHFVLYRGFSASVITLYGLSQAETDHYIMVFGSYGWFLLFSIKYKPAA
jgi:hypothetical protein